MGEEVRNTGNRAEDRLIALLQEFNWEYIGGGRDIECASRKHDRDEHGIDGYMAYEDPYLSAERGRTNLDRLNAREGRPSTAGRS